MTRARLFARERPHGRGALGLMLAVTTALAGCQKTPPRVTSPVVALAIPDAPARLLIPVELPAPREADPVVVEAPPPAPAPPRRDPVAAARPTEKPVPPPDTPAPVLRTTPDAPAAERQIQSLIGAAQQSLSKVSYRELNANARIQYDQAKSFIRMADDALKVKNYNFAESLARRAESIARLLVTG